MSWVRKDDEDLRRKREEIRWSKKKKHLWEGIKARGDEAAEGNKVVLQLGGLKRVGILAGEKVGEENWIPMGGSRHAMLRSWDLILTVMGNGCRSQTRQYTLVRPLSCDGSGG